MAAIIKIDRLSKAFTTRESFPGVFGALKSLFWGRRHSITAIDNLSLEIQEGERIAFIGPNGAGKSTTIKILTGILHPTSGHVEVLGLVPWEQRTSLGYLIGTVFGQRSQLWYHLPPGDTFGLLAKIYEIPPDLFNKRLEKLVTLFDIAKLLHKPVRALSLGERMRCELVASLLHQPKILFLDEPTIGLDINGKLMIRELLNKLSEDYGTTLFLTSHDTADIEQVCDRVVVIDKGTVVLDSPLKDLKRTYMKKKVLTLTTDEETLALNLPGIAVLENAHHHFKCEIDLSITPIEAVIHKALQLTSLKDVTIENPSMEEVIRMIYGISQHG